MTISTGTNNVVYRGNGATTEFAVPFKVLDADHLVVTRRDFTSGETAYTYIGTDYDFVGIGDDAGTLTLDGTALSSDFELVIERVVPYTQDLDIVNAGGFYPETVEEQLDLIVMGVQQIADLAGRGAVVPIGEEGLVLPKASDRAGMFFAFDADGNFSPSSGTGTDGGLRTDLAAASGPSLLGFLSLGANAVLRSLLGWLRDQPLSMEGFGAAGDGVTNDAVALDRLITAAIATGISIKLKKDAVYAIGAAGWTGLSYALDGDDLAIDGNGASLKLLVQPSQQVMPAFAATKKAFLRFIGDSTNRGRITIRNLIMDLNNIEASGIVTDYLDPLFADNHSTRQGYAGTPQSGLGHFVCFRANRLNAVRNYVRDGFQAFYCGHTDTGTHCSNATFDSNDIGNLSSDGIVGVMHRCDVVNNKIDGCFSGIVASGFGTNSAQCTDWYVAGNTVRNFLTAGFQTDLVKGTAAGPYRPARMRVIANTLIGATGAETGINGESLDDFDISRNAISNVGYGITVDGAANGAVEVNRVSGSTANGEYSGIRAGTSAVDGSVTSVNVTISRNFVSGFSFNYRVNAGTEVTLLHNRATGGTFGIYFDGAATGRCEGNTASGASSTDIDVRALECTFRHNRYTSSYQTRFGLTVVAGVITLGRWDHYQLFEGSDVDITSISGGKIGQDARFYCSTAHQTFKNGAGIIPKGAVDTKPSANGFIGFTQVSAGLWLETGRSY